MSDGRLANRKRVSESVDKGLSSIYGYHMSENAKTTIYLDEADYRRLKAMARAQGRPSAQLVREAVALYVTSHAATVRPASIAAGHSGRRNLSERTDELLTGFGER